MYIPKKTLNERVEYKNPKRLLIAASILTIIMAVPHFFVPFIFPWEQLTGTLYPPVKWALFAMNFFFSLLLFWGGLLSLITSFKWIHIKAIQYWIFGGMGLFWASGAVYELIIPFPMVEAQYVLPGAALSIACLYGIALLLLNKQP